MKVCRMCWSLLDEQLNRCHCAQGADPSIFFKDTSEMVNHFVTHERLMSKRTRRLEELVKKKIKEIECDISDWEPTSPSMIKSKQASQQQIILLQSLLEDSQSV